MGVGVCVVGLTKGDIRTSYQKIPFASRNGKCRWRHSSSRGSQNWELRNGSDPHNWRGGSRPRRRRKWTKDWRGKNVEHEKLGQGRFRSAYGVRYGHFEVVKLLIDADRELLGVVNGDKESPLLHAVEGGFFHIAKHILEKFPDSLPPCGGYNAMNALHAAVIRTH